MLRNETEAQDIVQETFLAAFHKLPSFSRRSPFRAWLFRIATNACLMRLRTRRRRREVSLSLQGPLLDDAPWEHLVVDRAPSSDSLLQTRELGERIQRAVNHLPESYRQVLVLADYQHCSMKEIADQLELTVPNAKTRLHRARLSVRSSLAQYLRGAE